MKERPILFSAPMVRALLEGRKTQTRRMVKPQPVSQGIMSFGEAWKWNEGGEGWFSGVTAEQIANPNYGLIKSLPCPYGKPGDRMWVRETWRTGKSLDGFPPRLVSDMAIKAGYRPSGPVWYEADGIHRAWGDNDDGDFGGKGKVRVSIHMPRWASRITLAITNVRVQRLQDISEEDAQAEGFDTMEKQEKYGLASWSRHHHPNVEGTPAARKSFIGIWESINGPASWAANPWVWAVSFEVPA